MAALSRDYMEPTEGPTAKVRFSTNGELRLIPDRNCVDWSAPGSGVVVSDKTYLFGKPSHIGKKINMSGTAPAGMTSAEVLVAGDKPVTVDFYSYVSIGDWRYWCQASIAFIPKANEEYQVAVEHDGPGGKCSFPIRSLTSPLARVQTYFVKACTK